MKQEDIAISAQRGKGRVSLLQFALVSVVSTAKSCRREENMTIQHFMRSVRKKEMHRFWRIRSGREKNLN